MHLCSIRSVSGVAGQPERLRRRGLQQASASDFLKRTSLFAFLSGQEEGTSSGWSQALLRGSDGEEDGFKCTEGKHGWRPLAALAGPSLVGLLRFQILFRYTRTDFTGLASTEILCLEEPFSCFEPLNMLGF